MDQIHWNELGVEHLHWSRVFYRAGSSFKMHAHDFAEFFLVETGAGWHEADGQRYDLSPGDLVFIHPYVEHRTGASSSDSLVYVNIAVPAAMHSRLHSDFFAAADDWIWNRSAAQTPHRLHADDRQAVANWFDECERRDPDALCTQTMVCDVLRRVQVDRSDRRLLNAPDWLRDALRVFDDPQHYHGGVQHLADLAGVGREHLSRSVRKVLSCTASELVNELRLEFAKKQLLFTNRSVQDIYLDCGYGNLSHFHRVFRARFGTTPKRYRDEHRRSLI